MYRWTKKNHLIQMGSGGLGVGGGSHPAIFLHADLINGTSGPCETFDCPCLAGAQDFEVVYVEIWALDGLPTPAAAGVGSFYHSADD
jgi:hypothetical protein